MTTYSKEFKEKMIAKLLPPSSRSVVELSNETGISPSALYGWRATFIKKSLSKGVEKMTDKNSQHIRPQNWSAEAKLNAVIKISSMAEEEIGAYCRENGIYSHYLDEWKQAIIKGLKPSVNKEQKVENLKLKTTIKELESDLRRKEKALAETSALLVLKKKAKFIWGDEKDD